MHARDLARHVDVLVPSDPLTAAFQRIESSSLPGLVVRTRDGFVVVPASQVLRVALPRYVLDDPALGRVWDESSADAVAARLASLQVSDLLAAQERPGRPHGVDGDATLVEIAAVMAAAHVPLVVVVEDDALLGVVTAHQLIGHLAR
ncbi:CBS domain-containing protein [Cellulomonas sp. URHB0016]